MTSTRRQLADLIKAPWRDLVARGTNRIHQRPPPVPAAPPPPPAELIDFLRQIGVALCQAGDAANRITFEMEELADAYGVSNVHFFVVPTGVFVRIGTASQATVDFAPAELSTLRLDQISHLYDLLDEAKRTR